MLVKVQPDLTHPTGKAMCMKGKAAPELLHSPNRLMYPMRRTNPKGAKDPGWERISWDQALTEVAKNLAFFKEESGPESVVFGVTTPSGTPMSDSIDWVERFIWLYGSPNLCYATEICNWHKDFAHVFTFGCGMPTADYKNSEVILLWGNNPANTWLAQADAIAHGRCNGATVIVIDPRPTALAREADVWMRVHPGTDGALAMGIANAMLAVGSVDEVFVRRWTNAPLLVRNDTSHFLRERDLDAKSPHNRYVIWNASQQRLEFTGEESATSMAESALHGTIAVTLRDASGQIAQVDCTPAFDLYARALKIFTPDYVASITGVPAEQIVKVAKVLAPGRRIAYHAWSGVGQHTNATQTERAIATLYALTGAFDTRGSNREFAKQPVNAVSTYALLSPQQRAKALGLSDRPIGPPAQGWVAARDVYRAILEAQPYRVRALVAFGTNLLLSQADSAKAHEALCALDFHVHCDLFETPSSRYADILLPVNTPWEREALRVGFEINEEAVELVQLRQRMVPPRGESRADYDIVFDLAVRLGMADQFFGGNIEAGWNHMLAPLGLDVSTLRKHPEGIAKPLTQRERNYTNIGPGGPRGFETETLRVELYSEKLLRHGYSPVPEFIPPGHGSRSGSDDRSTYPLTLTSIKNGYYCHSQQRSLASLRRRAPYPTAELSAELAIRKGIIEDDWILIQTFAGSARFRARVIAELARDVIIAEYGWWQACDEIGMKALPTNGRMNSNFGNLVSGECIDPISGSSPLRCVPCDVALDPSVDQARRAWRGFRDFVVTSTVEEATGVRTVVMSAEDGGMLPDYLPGQHITIHVPGLGTGGTTRAYSLVGAAIEEKRRTYTISVRHQRGIALSGEAFEGSMSAHIHRALKIGHRISVRAPNGTFVLPLTSNQPVVMFAGGIGITPFISYLESLLAEREAPEAWLFYANLNSASHAFRRRLVWLRERLPSLHILDCYSKPGSELIERDFDMQGFITADVVADDLIQRRARFYFCGPEPMMNAITAGLVDRGVPPFDMFKEVFRSPTKPRLDPSQKFVVEFMRSGIKAEWTPDKGSLLSFAESLGVSMPSGCRVGQCESCAVRIAAGKVDHMSGNGPDESNMCFACQAIPASEITIEA